MSHRVRMRAVPDSAVGKSGIRHIRGLRCSTEWLTSGTTGDSLAVIFEEANKLLPLTAGDEQWVSLSDAYPFL